MFYLGLMYYFIFKVVNCLVYSYCFLIIYFWVLIFIYIWVGFYYLFYIFLLDWVQFLGMVFFLMLIVLSWGGMLNGLLMFCGVWDCVCNDFVLKFMVVVVIVYGMVILEGLLMFIKSVNVISYYIDWIIGYVYIGILGWNGMFIFGMFYWLFFRLYNIKLYFIKLVNVYFWIGIFGILFYVILLYWVGWMQSLMWKEFLFEGIFKYGNFLEIVIQILLMYCLCVFGGIIYVVGVFVMFYNFIKMVCVGEFVGDEEVQVLSCEVVFIGGYKGEYWYCWIECCFV